MRGSIEWPDLDLRGVVSVHLTRQDLKALLIMLDSGAGTCLLRVDDELVLSVHPEEHGG